MQAFCGFFCLLQAQLCLLKLQQIEEAEDGNYKGALFASLLSAVKLRASETIHNVLHHIQLPTTRAKTSKHVLL